MKFPLIIKQGLRFGLVGIMNTLMTFGVFVLFFRVFKTGENLANITGYIIGVINSFVWNKFWTFRSSEKTPGKIAKEILLFLLVFAVSLGFQMLLFRFLLARGLVAEIAELGAMVLYTIINFFGNRFLTFQKASE